MCNISYEEDQYGSVSVQIEGTDFVKGSMCYEIWLDIDAQTGFYTPYWPQNSDYTVVEGGDPKNVDKSIFSTDGKKGDRIYNIENAKVFNMSKEISSEAKTDVGKLRSLLYARGDHRADYTDIPFYDSIKDSVLMNVQAEFDQLVHNVISQINGVLENAAGVRTVSQNSTGVDLEIYNAIKNLDGDKWYDGKVYKIHEDVDDGFNYMEDSDGAPLQLFKKSTSDGYTKLPAGSTYGAYWVYNEEEMARFNSKGQVIDSQGRVVANSELAGLKYSLYSTTNTVVNQDLLQTPSLLGFRLEDGSEDVATMTALKKVFTDEKFKLNPDVIKKVNLNDYYSDLVAQISNTGFMFNSIYDNQAKTVSATESARDQVEAVSTDEELNNMIKFQSAYNASSRFINVVDEMLEHIITSLA